MHGIEALNHLKQYGADKLDSTTLDHLKDFMEEWMAETIRIRATFTADHPVKAEWDEMHFADFMEMAYAVQEIDAQFDDRSEQYWRSQ